MARRQHWSFLMPADEHVFIRFISDRYQAFLTPLGQALFWGAVAASLMSMWGLSPAVLCFSCCGGAIAGGFISGLPFRPKLKLTRAALPPVSAGDTLHFRVRVENPSVRRVRNILIEERSLPIGMKAVGDLPQIESLDPGEQAEVDLALSCQARGVYDLTWLQAATFFPSALVKWPQRFWEPARITVYPRVIPVARFEVPQGRPLSRGQLSGAPRLGEPSELAGTREWREGDRTRDIDWSAYARTGQLTVKEYQEDQFVRLAMLIDLESRNARDDQVFEKNLSLAAGVAEVIARQEYWIDPIIAGTKLYRFDAGRSAAHFESVLEVLAQLETTPRTHLATAETALMAEASRLSAVVWIAKTWDLKRTELFRKLKDHGISVRVLSAGIKVRPADLATHEWVDPS